MAVHLQPLHAHMRQQQHRRAAAAAASQRHHQLLTLLLAPTVKRLPAQLPHQYGLLVLLLRRHPTLLQPHCQERKHPVVSMPLPVWLQAQLPRMPHQALLVLWLRLILQVLPVVLLLVCQHARAPPPQKPPKPPWSSQLVVPAGALAVTSVRQALLQFPAAVLSVLLLLDAMQLAPALKLPLLPLLLLVVLGPHQVAPAAVLAHHTRPLGCSSQSTKGMVMMPSVMPRWGHPAAGPQCTPDPEAAVAALTIFNIIQGEHAWSDHLA